MRVLHLISSSGLYGAEAVILQLCAQRQGGVQGSLCVFFHAGQPIPVIHTVAAQAGISAALLPCHGQFDRSLPGRLREMVRQCGADVLHCHGYKADVYAALAYLGRNHRPALVSTCHTWYDNDWAVRLYGALDRSALGSFDEVVAVSREVAERLLSAGIAPGRIHCIHNGVTVPSESQMSAQPLAGGTDGTLRVGLVGRLAPEKGIDIFLQAAAQLLAADPEVRFAVAGEGPARPALEVLRHELGLDRYLRFLGSQADMAPVYRSFDILVSASRQEGLPMALLEGMAYGLPIVATRVGEVPAVVLDGVTGYLVMPESPTALAAAIRMLLRSPDRRQSFSEAARQRVHEYFSAERMTDQYALVYRRACHRRRKRSGAVAGIAGTGATA